MRPDGLPSIMNLFAILILLYTQRPVRCSRGRLAHTTRCSTPTPVISAISTDSTTYVLSTASVAPLYRSVPASTMLPFPFDVESTLGFTVTVTNTLVTAVVANVMVLLGVGSNSW